MRIKCRIHTETIFYKFDQNFYLKIFSYIYMSKFFFSNDSVYTSGKVIMGLNNTNVIHRDFYLKSIFSIIQVRQGKLRGCLTFVCFV